MRRRQRATSDPVGEILSRFAGAGPYPSVPKGTGYTVKASQVEWIGSGDGDGMEWGRDAKMNVRVE